MKELLSRLIKHHVVIFLKSGDHIENVVILAVVGNVLVASCRGKIAFIEIPHVAYVLTDTEAADVVKDILRSEQEDEKKDDKKDDKKDHKKDGKKDSKKDHKKDDKKEGKKR